MSKSQRDKGAAGERECAELWRRVFPEASRSCSKQARGGVECPDLEYTGPYWVEVGRGRGGNTGPTHKMAQAARDSDGTGRIPIACTRRDHGEWLATMRLEDLLGLVLAARHGAGSASAPKPGSDHPWRRSLTAKARGDRREEDRQRKLGGQG